MPFFTIVFSLVVATAALGMPHQAMAGIYRFSPTEHKPILTLSQQVSLEPEGAGLDDRDLFIEFLEPREGEFTIQILPRTWRGKYRLHISRAASTEKTRLLSVHTDNDSVTPLIPERVGESGAVYLLDYTFFHGKFGTYEPRMITIDPIATGQELVSGVEVSFQKNTLKKSFNAEVEVGDSYGYPQHMRPLSSMYTVSGAPIDISSKVSMRYTDTSADSKAIYVYNPSSRTWSQLNSYNNVEERIVTATLPSFAQSFALFATTKSQDGIASWYAYKKCLCAASRQYAKGTRLKVTRLKTKQSVVVTVNDYGPEEWTGRLIDLDAVAFKKIGSLGAGLIYVAVEPVVAEQETP